MATHGEIWWPPLGRNDGRLQGDFHGRRHSVNGHLFLPNYGHLFSPAAATFSPHWWPSFLPTEWVAVWVRSGASPLAGGRLGEPVAVLPLGDDYVRVMHQPVDGRGRERLGHQFVEPGRVDV